MRKGKLLLTTLAITATMSITTFAGQWQQDTTGWFYQNDDGSYQVNQWFQDFDGIWYYFNEAGYMLTNSTAPDGRQVGADGKWIEPVVGKPKNVLVQINNWVIGDIWNSGFCDFYHYEEDGKDSTGSTIDIEYAYQIFKEKYKQKAGYDAYINSLPDEYASLKTVWSKLNVESDKLYQYYNDHGIVQTGTSVDNVLFVQYRNAFSDYVYELAYK